ncbi:hypothetical protein Fmac_026104 [Flemingia macrophylla]|uniref:Uncharacterized protein n=1 Tax=Flemingia macrophylla TaxID=520843 RepID=A0ABD1LFJ6_9FABA
MNSGAGVRHSVCMPIGDNKGAVKVDFAAKTSERCLAHKKTGLIYTVSANDF